MARRSELDRVEVQRGGFNDVAAEERFDLILGITITPARSEHLEVLAEIELAAATMLKGHAPASVLETIVRDETGRGLDRAQRVVMVYRVRAF